MIPLLDHPSAEVRAAAFKAMRILKVPDAEILRGLCVSLRSRVDAHLIGCVGRLPGTDAIDALAGLLRREPGWQDVIVRAMGSLRDPRALPVLAELLARETGTAPPGFHHVLDALVRIDHPDVPGMLEQELDTTRRRLHAMNENAPAREALKERAALLERQVAALGGARGGKFP